MKVSRISVIAMMIFFLTAGICFSQVTGEYYREGVQYDTEARFEEEYVEQIKQLIIGLEYSDEVAQDFVQMVSEWKDIEGQPVLVAWKEKLAEAKEDYKEGEISKVQLAEVEESIAKELSQRIKKQISRGPDEFFNLTDVIKHKQAQCLGYSQIFYVLGNSVGLSVKAIDVAELMIAGPLSTGYSHIACIVRLTDGNMMMVDLVRGGFVSKPFIIKKEFTKVGNYWELKDKDNPLGIHRRIQILDRNGLTAGIYNNRGVVYKKLGQYTQAMSDYNSAIELNPKLAEAYTNRGVAYYDLGQYTQAISDYTKAIEVNPKYAEAYNNRGNAYTNLGQLNQAISDYNSAIELNPKLAVVYLNRGFAYACLGKFEEAEKDLLKAIELDPALKAYAKKVSDHFKLNLKLE